MALNTNKSQDSEAVSDLFSVVQTHSHGIHKGTNETRQRVGSWRRWIKKEKEQMEPSYFFLYHPASFNQLIVAVIVKILVKSTLYSFKQQIFCVNVLSFI